MCLENTKSVWIISELYYPSETSTGFILTKLAEQLSTQFLVNVLTGPTSYTSDSGKYLLQESINGVDIERVKVPYLNKNSTAKRAFRLLLISTSLAIKLVKKIKSNDTMIVVTNPVPLLFFVALLRKIKSNSKLIIIVHDVYPNNMLVAGLLKKESIIYRTIDLLYSKSLKAADTVVVLGRDMKDVILKKGVTNIEIVENWAENDRINADPVLRESDSLSLSNTSKSCKFLFAGNLGKVQGIPVLLEAIQALPKGIAKFTFAGNGAYSKMVEEFSTQFSDDVDSIGSYLRDDQEKIIGDCDIGIVSLAPNMYGLGVPSKAYNLMAAGKPILYIGDEGSEIDLIVKQYDCGWSVTDISSNCIKDTIVEISGASKTTLKEKGQNSKYLAIEKYTLTNAAKKYQHIVSSVS